MRRLLAYGLLSTGLTGSVVVNAVRNRPNFFAAAVALGKSSGSLMVLGNFVLFLAILTGMGFKRVFFGTLRQIEYEHMFERLWIFLTESLLALTIFREDFSASFLMFYGVLVFLKCFHWVSGDRVDYMDQVPPPGPPTSYHVRMASVMSVLTVSDLVLFSYALQSSINLEGRTANVLFASEFAILIASICGIWARYIVGILDLRHAQGRVDAPVWEEKSMYLFYIDLAVDFAKLLTYLIFCIVIFINHGFPIHILRDVYMTMRSFMARWTDLMRYRRATRNMDEQYPDATVAELEASGDHTCIICREEMVARGSEDSPQDADGPNVTPKKLGCGHIFHFHCLRSWLERQQACPTCRRDVLSPARAPEQPRQQPPAGQQQQNPQPQPQPRAAGLAAGVAAAAAENTRAVFEEYFRMPAVNGDAPAFPPPNRDQQQNQQVDGATRQESGSTQPLPTGDEERQRSIWGAPITPGRFVRPPLGAAPRWPEATVARSGTATPSSSQAPPVFTLPGQTRRRPDEEFDENDMPLRHAAAAAALRRFEDKGKGKQKAWDEAPTQRAYLSESSGPAGPSSVTAQDASIGRLGDISTLPTTRHEARDALDQRLTALRAIDRQVWGLVTELSRLKSAWDFEDNTPGSAPAARRSSTSPAPRAMGPVRRASSRDSTSGRPAARSVSTGPAVSTTASSAARQTSTDAGPAAQASSSPALTPLFSQAPRSASPLFSSPAREVASPLPSSQPGSSVPTNPTQPVTEPRPAPVPSDPLASSSETPERSEESERRERDPQQNERSPTP